MSSSDQPTKMPRSATRKILAVIGELLLPISIPHLLVTFLVLSLPFSIALVTLFTQFIRPVAALPMALLYTFLGICAYTTVLLSAVNLAAFGYYAGSALCRWVLLEAYLAVTMPGSRGQSVTNGGEHGMQQQHGPVPEWVMELVYRPRVELARLFPETVRVAAEVWEWVERGVDEKLLCWILAQQGGEDRLREWEDDLNLWEEELAERDDLLQKLEKTLKEWETGLRECLDGLRAREWQDTLR